MMPFEQMSESKGVESLQLLVVSVVPVTSVVEIFFWHKQNFLSSGAEREMAWRTENVIVGDTRSFGSFGSGRRWRSASKRFTD
jgi:hypothetical protein